VSDDDRALRSSREVSLSNIMVTHDGAMKLIDFATAHGRVRSACSACSVTDVMQMLFGEPECGRTPFVRGWPIAA
jgi:hypothetical protein